MGIADFFKKIFSGTETELTEDFTEENPVEQYDFFIEADERFDDEKNMDLWDFRDVDAVAVLESMNLCDDVKNHWGVRRKFQKLFEEVSFEIDGFASYEDGKSIENSVTEDIDDRTLQITVSISKNSDNEPFNTVFSVKQI